MPGPLAKSGDLLVPNFEPALFVPPTLVLVGTAQVLIDGMPAVLETDLEVLLAELVVVYTMLLFEIPGFGRLTAAPTPGNFARGVVSRGSPLVVAGLPIPGVFEVMDPAIFPGEPPVVPPVPDPEAVKPGTFEIVPVPLVDIFGG